MDPKFSDQIILSPAHLDAPMTLCRMPSELRVRSFVSSHASVALSLTGKGHRVYKRAGRSMSLYTAPHMLEVTAAGHELDEGWWRHEPSGQALLLELPGSVVHRLLGEGAAASRIATHHEVFSAQIEQLMRLLWQEVSAGSPSGSLYSDGLTTAVIGLLLHQFGKNVGRRSTSPGLSQLQRSRVVDFIEASLALDLSVDQLAAVAEMSADRFGRAFKRTFGTSPHAFVVARRIDRAVCLLRSTPSMSLAEVAAATGFASQAHLTQTFTARVGMPPGAWRRGQCQ